MINEMLSDIQELTNSYIRDLKLSSAQTARECVTFLSKVITKSRWSNAQELISILKEVGKCLREAHPTEAILGNLVRHILKLIRDEYATCIKGQQDGEAESLHKLGTRETEIDDFTKSLPNLKTQVMESIQELLEELDTSERNIATQSVEHIHSEEVIMTLGSSQSVESFLKYAAKKRKFHVIVAETAPSYKGQELGLSLAKDNIETTVITDAAIFALMSRVNKVIIGCESVLANGGLMTCSGGHSMALAASHHSVPLIVCASVYSLTPQYSVNREDLGQFVSPETVLDYSQAGLVSQVHVLNPLRDYVPPELVTLFISNLGGNAPSYVYRLLSELYHPDDYEL